MIQRRHGALESSTVAADNRRFATKQGNGL